LDLLEEMAGNSQIAVKTVNIHQSKIEAVKFDGLNNFGMWRCDVMDVRTTSNLVDTLRLEERLEDTSKKD